jgi:lipoprotein-anchoring transpeptidase ErfK/SrfK
MSGRRMLIFLVSFVMIVGIAAPASAQTSGPSQPVGDVQLAQSITTTLRRGDSGPQVRALQERLRYLKYWVGTVDGKFGNLTQQAVYAFQKVQGLSRDGIVGSATRAALKNPKPVGRKTTSGRAVEIDKRRQVLILIRDGKTKWIFNTSTGTEKRYTYEGRTYLADTPVGKWRVFRQVNGWRDGELGHLYRPKYFHVDGIAIHGYTSVPPYPASHGCARVSIAAMDFLWDKIPLETRVWIY